MASSIAILLNYGAKWRLLYYIFYVLCLDFEMSVIIDPMILYFRETDVGAAEERLYKFTVLDQNGLFRRLVGFSRIERKLENLSSTFVYSCLVILLIIFGLICSILALK